MKVYGLRNCDSCRKAIRDLAAEGHEAELVDVRQSPLDAATLARFHAELGDGLLNTRSTTWRGLSEAERAAPALTLLADHPALMKRPVFETADGALYLGWATLKSSGF